MPASKKYPEELRQRAQRMVAEAMSEESSLSMTGAVGRIGPRVGVVPETVRGWIRQADIDGGRRSGTSTDDASEVKVLKAEVRELKRANEIFLAASSYVGDRCQEAVSSSRWRSPSKTFCRPIWPLSEASSRWAWRVGRNSMVVTKKVQDSQIDSKWQSSSTGRAQ